MPLSLVFSALWLLQKLKQLQNAVLQIHNLILAYQTDVGEYPSTLEDLVRRPTTGEGKGQLANGGYAKKDQLWIHGVKNLCIN